MPRNQVQFQKGFSLGKFLSLYGTEEQCRNKLFHSRWSKGFCCPKCGGDRYYLIESRQLYQCTQCRHQCSLKSGTIFASSKLPLTTWYLAIYLITQSKEGISALSLRRYLGITINAAMKLKHKLQHVMKKADDQLMLEGFVELDDAYWGGKRRGGKRGRGASGKTHFLAAVARNEKGHPIHMRMSKVPSFKSIDVDDWALKHLHSDSVVITDQFSAFNGIADHVSFHGSIKASDLYVDPENKVFHWINTMIGNVKKAIHGTYHHVSSKHLPRYLAEFCFRFNNRFYLGSMVDDLISHAASTYPKPQRILKFAEE